MIYEEQVMKTTKKYFEYFADFKHDDYVDQVEEIILKENPRFRKGSIIKKGTALFFSFLLQ